MTVPTISSPRVRGSAGPPPPAGIDVGRVGVVTLVALTAMSNAGAVVRHLTSADPVLRKVTEVVASLLALTFSVLVVRAYLARGRATATDRGPLVWFAAPVATVVPLGLAAAPTREWGAATTAVQLGLTLAGLAISVWAIRSLAANISVVPQVRTLVGHGPYRWVRHPLYVGEFVALCGLALHVGRVWVIGVVAAQVILQGYRALREERLLRARMPGYAQYAERTRLLLPGVW